jgi:hypothetical protein
MSVGGPRRGDGWRCSNEKHEEFLISSNLSYSVCTRFDLDQPLRCSDAEDFVYLRVLDLGCGGLLRRRMTF